MGSSESRFINETGISLQQRRDPSKYSPNTVYYLGEKLTTAIREERTEIVTEIIVCKTSLIDHWYIKVVLDADHEDSLEIHYLNNSSIIVQYPKEVEYPRSIRETRYTPTFRIDLSDVLRVCQDFVNARSYNLLSYNCQDFVIALTNRFTDRATLSLLLFSHRISRGFAKTKIMNLEKEFLLQSKRIGVRLAIQCLQQTNAEIRDEIDRRASEGQVSGPEIEHFVRCVLTPENGDYRASDFENFLKRQENERVAVIRETMMQSWRLASFVIFLEEGKWQDQEGILPPHKALKQYQTYN